MRRRPMQQTRNSSRITMGRRWIYVLPLGLLLAYLAHQNLSGTSRPTTRVTPGGTSLNSATAVVGRGSVTPVSDHLTNGAMSSHALASGHESSSSSSSSKSRVTTADAVTTTSSEKSGVTLSAISEATGLRFPPPPPACTSLSCAGRFNKAEPEWGELAFQPGINWAAGGLRGDCVAGELEYIMDKYCSAPGRPPHPLARRHKFPSEERLNALDVHSKGRPMADLKEIIELMPNRTFLLMGDSVMEQFYNTLQCFLRKEGIEVSNDKPFLDWIQQTAPLWRMGKRKKPPKLPQRAVGNTRLLYARVTTYQPDEVAAAAQTADVIILNWGLHYQVMAQYKKELTAAFEVLDQLAAQPGKAVLFSETGAQHFKASDARGYTTGEWEHRDKSADSKCTCQPIEDYNVNVRNRVLAEVLGTGRFNNVQTLPFYELTRPRWRWHFGNCTKRPNGAHAARAPHLPVIHSGGRHDSPPRALCSPVLTLVPVPVSGPAGWNYYTCCDCTHFCFSPAMWHAHLHSVKLALLRSPGIGGRLLASGRT